MLISSVGICLCILVNISCISNLLGKPPNEPITKVISKQLDINLGQFTQEELDSVLRKLKIEKQQGLVKSPQKYGRPGNSTT